MDDSGDEVRDLIAALQREVEALRSENAALRQEAELRRRLDANRREERGAKQGGP